MYLHFSIAVAWLLFAAYVYKRDADTPWFHTALILGGIWIATMGGEG